MRNKVFKIQLDEIYEESLKSCIEMCEIQVETVRGKKVFEKCIETRDKFCKDCVVKVLVTPFSRECVKEDAFKIKDKVIYCNALGKVDSSKIIGGYMYAVFVQSLNGEKMSAVQIYYAECWLSAYAEATWKGMKPLLINESMNDFSAEEYKGKLFISESYAPGFNNIRIESVAEIFSLMNLSEHGMALQGEYGLMPSQSIIGIYLVNI